MNIVSLNTSSFGALSVHLANAINKYTTHHAVSIQISRCWAKFPFMLIKNPSNEKKIKQLIKNADVLHFNESLRLFKLFNINPRECQDKKVIFHAHGTFFRHHSKQVIDTFEQYFPKPKFIVSTPDLLYYCSGTWFPSVVPIKEWRRKYTIKRNNPPIIYYSPSGDHARALTPLKWFTNALNELRAKGLKVHYHKVTGISHEKNLERKSKADIYYDDILIGYGQNAIEAAVFEMPVVCGMSSFTANYFRSHNIKVPFNVANRHNLKKTLQKLIEDRNYRLSQGNKCYNYVKQMHSLESGVKRFLKLIE